LYLFLYLFLYLTSRLAETENEEVVSMIDAAAGFMSNTLNDVLSMSRIEDGAISLVVKPFALLSLLDSAIKTIRNLAVSKAVRVVVNGMSPRDEAHGLVLIGDEVRVLTCTSISPLSRYLRAFPL
jgi:signal transduction histidine kinase